MIGTNPCVACEGEGFNGTGWKPCPRCHGFGNEPEPLTPGDAKRRTEVLIPGGRTAWLVYLPGRRAQRSGNPERTRGPGRTARVVLASGKYLSVDPADLTRAPGSPTLAHQTGD